MEDTHKKTQEYAKAVFAKNLGELMRQAGVTQAHLVSHFGITASTVSDWCNGKKYPRVDKLQMLADYFGVTKPRLTEESVPGAPYEPTRRIPILGRVSAGLPLYAEQHVEGYTYIDRSDQGEYFALRVQGSSMNALRICDGDLLIVRRQDIVENGEIAVVLVDDDEATVKRFYLNDRTVTLMPQSTDPSHQPQTYKLTETRVRVLGKVVENKIIF